MATIKSLTFTITRTSHSVGHICKVDYSYDLEIDASEYYHDDAFSVIVELHGEDMLLDQSLGKRFYDAHVVDGNQQMPIKRNFVVPCEILDEALGRVSKGRKGPDPLDGIIGIAEGDGSAVAENVSEYLYGERE